MTPSLANFFWGLLYGAVVVGGILAAVIFVSQQDKISRS
ncbi:MAG: Photosystem II reaction center X protein [Alkalinema sp. CACIAM 70d]|nr:MAG: Photosystem II reaction center X protein [Alkalinema sp. CACIAM 70d]